ncbi:MAG: hypothetical protein ACRD9L_26880, partial [Bryobacteraceae bacterium]
SRNCTRENRETSPASSGLPGGGIGTESQKRKLGLHAGEESNTGILPAKLPNKDGENANGGGGGGKARDQGEQHGI